jgi:signal transduction histidine kinase
VSVKFEYKISFAYFLLGALWILFSDKAVLLLMRDNGMQAQIQTYKGWFYVLVTAFIFYMFLKKHLLKLRIVEHELSVHKENLEQLVEEKTQNLDRVIEELTAKNETIHNQNQSIVKAMEDLKLTQHQLIQSEKKSSISTLIAGLAHEINNPLHFILGGHLGIKQYCKTNKPQDISLDLFLDSIQEGVCRIETIVNELNLLDMGNTSFVENCHLEEILLNCVQMAHSQFPHKANVAFPHTIENTVFQGNPAQLHLAFFNILKNSYQAITEDGEIKIDISVGKEKIKIKITDNGIGINEDDLIKVTDPFYTTLPPGKGVGLGLTLTYTIIEEHQGQFVIASKKGAGTKVEVFLPLKHNNNE